MTHKDGADEDLRVQRTHKLVLDALIDLTAQKGFPAVTVREITTRAGINRATFYRHYQDKFDLLNQYTKTVFALLDAPDNATRNPDESTVAQVPSGLVAIFAHIRDNAPFYRVMLGTDGDPGFAEQIRRYVQQRLLRSPPAGLKHDATALDLYLSASSGATMGAVLWWLEHDMPYTAEEMATVSFQLGAANLSAVAGLPRANRTNASG